MRPQEVGEDRIRTMTNITIDAASCDNSPYCPVKRVCPRDAVIPAPGGYAIDTSRCSSCGACLRVCPMGAVRYA